MTSPGLLNLRTDLKSLRYGSDKPYVTKDINNPPSSNQTGMQITKRVDDLSRISQMLIDRPGLKFIGNQALLQQVDIQDKLQKSRDRGKTLGGAILQQALGTVKQTAKILGSTLAQVPVNGTGTHFVYAFRTDTYLSPATTNSFTQFFGAGGVEGAPLALRGEKIEGTVQSNFYNPGETYITDTQVTPEEESLDLSKTTNKYLPKASSGEAADGLLLDAFLGTGIDPLNRTYVEQKKQNFPTEKFAPESTPGIGITTGSYIGPDGLSKKLATNYTSGSTYIAEQKRRFDRNFDVRKENRILLGDQGGRRDEAKSKNQYWVTGSNGAELDNINMLRPVTELVEPKKGRDIVKFRFHVITPGETRILYFRAFLDTFSDTYTGQWNPTKYIGRAEDFQVYGGFQRKITLSFKIAAATRSEMKPLYQKMIYLASSTAPTYTIDGQFMRGTIVEMTVGDYVSKLPGVMNSVNYSWNVEYPWEIAMTEPEGLGDLGMQELPMVMDCSIDFTPIHTFTPETGLKKYITAGGNFLQDAE
jgi:hypothetical protein